MNRRTKMVKRSVNLSWDIYVEENLKTFAEINNTTHEKDKPILSAINIIEIGLALMDRRGHSNRTELPSIIT
jgi:hypothetical protein